jgi:hypothetical protein
MPTPSRFALAVLAVAVSPLFVHASPVVSNPTFSQGSWYSTAGTLVTANSNWGRFDFDVVTDPAQTYYVNLVGTVGSNTSWLVQNFPVFDASITPGTVRYCADIDLTELGVSTGTAVPSLQYRYSVTPAPLGLAPIGIDTTAPVESANYTLRRIEEIGAEGMPDEPSPHKASNWATDVIEHKDVPRVMEDKRQCLPGAFARSISWLNQQYNLGSTKTAQQIYTELKHLVGFGHGYPHETRIAKKAAYLSGISNRAVTKVHDTANVLDPIPGVEESGVSNLLVWLNGELKTEDVELEVSYDSGGGHIVTIVGIFRQDGEWYLRYRDDWKQIGDRADAGDIGIKTYKFGFSTTEGRYWFGDPSAKINYCVSESVPEPGVAAPLFGVFLSLTLRRRHAPRA